MKSLSEVLASAPIPTESPETQSDFRDKWMNYRRSNRQTRDGVAAVMEECGMEPTDEALDKIIEEHSDIVKMDAEFQKPELQPERQPESKKVLDNVMDIHKKQENWDKRAKIKGEVGMSFNTPHITPNAIRDLHSLSKSSIIIYTYLTSYMDTGTCETKPRSKNEWMRFADISRTSWFRSEKELIQAGMIKPVESYKLPLEHPIRFFLPKVKEWKDLG